MPVIDAHIHVAVLGTLKLRQSQWHAGFASARVEGLYDEGGRPRPEVFADYLAAEGVDHGMLFTEYSPRVTGLQVIEDLLPFVRYDCHRFHLVANLNPHIHFPVLTEVRRQLDLGAIALKLHPVHAGFPLDLAELYPVYAHCEEAGVPIIIHAGTSNFPGARNRYANLDHVVDVVRDFPGCTFVLAHGGRGWSYDTAAFLALTYDNVWIDIAGLPPKRLRTYYPRNDFDRLARRFIFGSDWPGVPGIAHNVEAVRALGLPRETVEGILCGNAATVFGVLKDP